MFEGLSQAKILWADAVCVCDGQTRPTRRKERDEWGTPGYLSIYSEPMDGWATPPSRLRFIVSESSLYSQASRFLQQEYKFQAFVSPPNATGGRHIVFPLQNSARNKSFSFEILDSEKYRNFWTVCWLVDGKPICDCGHVHLNSADIEPCFREKVEQGLHPFVGKKFEEV
jgi:hypothetical protein